MNAINLHIPAWNELTLKQLLFVCKLFRQKLEANCFKLRAFLFLSGVKALPRKIIKDQVYWEFIKGKQHFWLTPEELSWHLHAVNFLTENCRLTQNILPVIRVGFWRSFGPLKACRNISWKEFIHAEAQFYGFSQAKPDKKIDYLNRLCAVLYRPQRSDYHPMSPRYDGDRRELFNDFVYPRRAKWFNLVSLNKRYAVYVFYSGCKNAMIEAHPKTFKGGSVVSSEAPKSPVESLIKLVHELNQGDVTKNEAIYNVPAWDVLDMIESMLEKQKKNPKK